MDRTENSYYDTRYLQIWEEVLDRSIIVEFVKSQILDAVQFETL